MSCLHHLAIDVLPARAAYSALWRTGRQLLSASLPLVFAALALPAAHAADISVEIGQSWSGKSALGSTHAGFVQVASGDAAAVLGGRFQINAVATVGVVGRRDAGNDRHEVGLAGVGIRVRRAGGGHWFWESHVFAAAERTSSLSGHLQFGSGFGYAYRAWEAKIRHISNAGLREPNHGETMFLIGYHF